MAKNDNLVHYLIDIANAIREKNGTTGLINAQDFAEAIKNGGNSGGGSTGGETAKVVDALHFLDYQYVLTYKGTAPKFLILSLEISQKKN